jgi:hypothetical protein
MIMSVLEHPSLVQVPLGDKFSLVLEANGHHVLLVLEPVGLKDSGLFVIMGPNREVELDGSGLFMSLFSFFLVLVGGDVATENERGKPRLVLVRLVNDRTVATEDERGEPSSFLDSTLVAEVDRGEHGTRGMTRSHGPSEMIIDLDGRANIDGVAGSSTRFDTGAGSSGGNRIDLSTGPRAVERSGVRGPDASFGTSATDGAIDPRETIVVPASSRTRRKVRAESSVVVGASARTGSGSRVVVVMGIPGRSAHGGVAVVVVCVFRTAVGAERPVDGSVPAKGRVGGDVGRIEGS